MSPAFLAFFCENCRREDAARVVREWRADVDTGDAHPHLLRTTTEAPSIAFRAEAAILPCNWGDLVVDSVMSNESAPDSR